MSGVASLSSEREDVGGDGRCICGVFCFGFGIDGVFFLVYLSLNENSIEGVAGVTRHVLC